MEKFLESKIYNGIDEDYKMIFNGPMKIKVDKIDYECHGKIVFDSIIKRTIIAEIVVSSNNIYHLLFNREPCLLKFGDYKPMTAFIVEGNTSCNLKLKLQGICEIDSTFVDYIDIAIENFVDILGKPIKYNDKSICRNSIAYKEWSIKIDKRDNFKQINNDLKYKRNYSITHILRLSRIDKSHFYTIDAEELIDALYYALSFVKGSFIGYSHGLGYHNNNVVYRRWDGNRVTYPCEFNMSWLNFHNINSFENYLEKMLHFFHHCNNDNTIKNIIWWYIEALSSKTTVENRVICIQTAMEYLLNFEKIKGKNVYRKFTKLLDNNYIPYGKSDLISFEEKIRNSESITDGPSICIYTRNNIVHPKKGDEWYSIKSTGIYKVLQMYIRYVELIILKMINYDGDYVNRLSCTWRGESEQVPWTDKK